MDSKEPRPVKLLCTWSMSAIVELHDMTTAEAIAYAYGDMPLPDGERDNHV